MFVTTNCLACGQTVMVPVEHFNTNRVAFHSSVGQRCSAAGLGPVADELLELLEQVEELNRSRDNARLRRQT